MRLFVARSAALVFSGAPTAAQSAARASKNTLPEMIQQRLADRFKLSVHRNRKEQLVYALVIAKDGAKLKPSRAKPEVTQAGAAVYTPQGDAHQLQDGTIVISSGPYGPVRGGRGPNGACDSSSFTSPCPNSPSCSLRSLDPPVVDTTHLNGAYELISENRPLTGDGPAKKSGPAVDDLPETGRPPDTFGEGLFAALRAAGLKLISGKAPVPVIVVDHLEKTPSAN